MSAHILVVDDERRFRHLYRQVLAQAGFRVSEAESAAEALEAIRRDDPDLVVSDVRMPGGSGLDLLRTARAEATGLPFLLVTAFADVRDAVEALKLGAVDYLPKPVDLDEFVVAVRDGVGLDHPREEDDLPADVLGGMVAASPAMRAVLRDAWRVASSDATVLLTGESGTGKEVVADFIHRNSRRAGGPLVAVNCGAIPSDLVASELFGHERGAFTGADMRRSGRFREAHGGTLFLDEIGELPVDLQPTLLRALETGRVTPVGSDREHQVDHRLIAATNQDLDSAIADGRFRADLYYRLNVIALELPPLRDRTEDILPLARHLLARLGHGDRRISAGASRCLQAHAWPGNVRELANAMERAALLSTTEVLLPEHLPPAVRAARPSSAVETSDESIEPVDADGDTLIEREVAHIRRVLSECGGNRTRAAERLGITRRGLINKIKRFEL
jgi:DNA-binding NtrC family response regulator